MLPQLSIAQFQIVYNSLSFVIASFLGGFLYFVLSRNSISPKYRTSGTIAAVIMTIACYHYFRIFNSWEAAYTLSGGIYVPTGKIFDSTYRYIDWILTVPLLICEMLLVLKQTKPVKEKIIPIFCVAAALMIVLGLVGESYSDPTSRTIWGILSTLPFIYVLVKLWSFTAQNVDQVPLRVRSCARNLKYLLIATWGLYPIVYALPNFGLTGACWTVAGQVLFCVGDVCAKVVFSILVHHIAVARSEADGYVQS